MGTNEIFQLDDNVVITDREGLHRAIDVGSIGSVIYIDDDGTFLIQFLDHDVIPTSHYIEIPEKMNQWMFSRNFKRADQHMKYEDSEVI